jgi:superfamily II DNA/RNA helicase
MPHRNSHNSSPNTTHRNRGSQHSSYRSPSAHRLGSSQFSRSPRRRGGERIDVSKFINKAVVEETATVFAPVHTFADFNIRPELKDAIVKKGYELPTPIQDQAIPAVLNGSDVLGIANTGTGKTGAFLIPLINKVRLNHREQILVVVPTRELAIQIESELKGLSTGMKIYSVCVVGGASMREQIRQLRYEYNFIIGTPGRLKDLIEQKMITLSEFNTVVLDEADRMLDMGFITDVREMMKALPKNRQTLFFSATLSSEIEKLIHEFLREPVRISVKKGDTAKSVHQDVVRVHRDTKLDTLHDLLVQPEFKKVLVFGRTKRGVQKLSEKLLERNIKAESIHGNKSHPQRQRALGKFKDNHAQVLVATDVAARGLDIADVTHVINYDLPETYDDYVHRIGRTGRGGKKGKALTFIE